MTQCVLLFSDWLCRFLLCQVVFRGGEGALQVLPPLVDVIPEARLNLVSNWWLQSALSDNKLIQIIHFKIGKLKLLKTIDFRKLNWLNYFFFFNLQVIYYLRQGMESDMINFAHVWLNNSNMIHNDNNNGPFYQCCALSIIIYSFHINKKSTSVDQFIMLNLEIMQSFIKMCCKLVKIWDPKLANFYKEMYCVAPGIYSL